MRIGAGKGLEITVSRRPVALCDPRWQIALVATASTAVTLGLAVLSDLPSGYRSTALHVSLETAAAVVALVVAFLVFGRLQREGRLADLLLACGLAVLAVTNFSFRAIPAVAEARNDGVIVWAAIGGRLLGALLLGAAATVAMRRLRDPARATVVGALAAAGGVAGAAGIAVLLRAHLPLPASPAAAADVSIRHPDLDVHPAFLTIQLVGAVLYAVAAVGFARRAQRRNDDFLRWLALACVLAVFSRVNYFLYPSSFTDWVYLGDVFRLGFFVVLLVGGLREIVGYWRVAADAAALNERRRLARDLHDGLAQEVAFLRSSIPALGGKLGDPDLVPRLAAAAERAERESRQLLAALASPADESFDVLLAEAIDQVAVRERVHVDLDLAPDVHVDHVRAEGLVRIAAEAVTNAARHAGVEAVRVTLEQLGPRVRLAVTDAGVGFDPVLVAKAARRGERRFGLASMRGRAAAIGADLSLSSRPGGGTRVEVVV